MENQWLAYAKRLQAIASTALHFCQNDFDRERFEEIAEIAHRMLADLADVPLERISDLIPDFALGYATPKVEVRGAVIENGKILLVREKSDGLWTMPGGYADIGLSASENVIKEVREEAGLDVTVQRLYSVRHKAKGLYTSDSRDFYKLYFLCERADMASEPMAGLETSEVGFFDPSDLPPLSRGRVIESDIVEALRFHDGTLTLTIFD